MDEDPQLSGNPQASAQDEDRRGIPLCGLSSRLGSGTRQNADNVGLPSPCPNMQSGELLYPLLVLFCVQMPDKNPVRERETLSDVVEEKAPFVTVGKAYQAGTRGGWLSYCVCNKEAEQK